MSSVSIVDYDIGNLLSVVRAFNHFNITVNVVKTADEILKADRLILPGVGAFQDGINSLSTLNLVEPIKEFTTKGKPFLGICLGMQLMLTTSHEFGEHQGLDIIPGEVIPVPKVGVDGEQHKIPHIGWNELLTVNDGHSWSDSIFQRLPANPHVYFVHSYMANPANLQMRLADTDYNGQRICAALKYENVYGCQFHPEKSGVVGLTIIEQFLNL